MYDMDNIRGSYILYRTIDYRDIESFFFLYRSLSPTIRDTVIDQESILDSVFKSLILIHREDIVFFISRDLDLRYSPDYIKYILNVCPIDLALHIMESLDRVPVEDDLLHTGACCMDKKNIDVLEMLMCDWNISLRDIISYDSSFNEYDSVIYAIDELYSRGIEIDIEGIDNDMYGVGRPDVSDYITEKYL
jgi:hypothetical protein